MPTTSFVRPLIYSIATLITALLTAAMLYNGWTLYAFNTDQHRQEVVQLAHQDARMIAERLEFYQDFLNHWAQQTQVQDLLTFVDEPKIQSWQDNMISLIPHVLSISLLNVQGEIIAGAEHLQIGQQCKADIKKILNPAFSRMQSIPAWLHIEPSGNKHVDLYAPIYSQEGKPLGFLFLNLRLEIFNKTFKQLGLVRQNEVYARLLDSHEQQIWELNESLSNSQKIVFNPRSGWLTTLKIRVNPTSWELEVSQFSKPDYGLAIILFISLLVGLLLIGGVAIVTQRLLTKDYLSDFEAVKELLNHLAESRPVQEFYIAPRLQETAKVFAAIRPNAEKIQQAHQKLQELSRTDELTQLANRRAYQEALLRAMRNAKEGHSVCLVLLDLDGFKRLNDTAGHPVGDQILKLLAGILAEHSRPKDLCARLGGDEFAAILPGMNQESVTQWIERIRVCFMHSQQEKFAQHPQCTISFGFTFIRGDSPEENQDRAFRRADHALYDAKKAGKNTFCQG